MKELPTEWLTSFERRLDQAKIPLPLRPAYLKWMKFYLYFCPSALTPVQGQSQLLTQASIAGTSCSMPRKLLANTPDDEYHAQVQDWKGWSVCQVLPSHRQFAVKEW
jgi:hypothetical protein